MQFFKSVALLVALVAGQFDPSAGQDAATLIAQLGSDAVSKAAVTSAIADSVSAALARINPIDGQLQEAIKQIVAQANSNAAANDQLNANLQTLLNSAETFTDADDNAASIFNGKLRAEGDK